MPTWVQVITGAAAVVVALGVLWSKLFAPMIKAGAEASRMLPVMQQLVEVFGDNPDAFKVLDDIAEQFKTDSGSTLRDVVNRLEWAATQLARKVDDLATTAAVVASELAASQRAADAIPAGGEPGQAADAAARSDTR